MTDEENLLAGTDHEQTGSKFKKGDNESLTRAEIHVAETKLGNTLGNNIA